MLLTKYVDGPCSFYFDFLIFALKKKELKTILHHDIKTIHGTPSKFRYIYKRNFDGVP